MINRFAKARLKEEVAKSSKAIFYAIKARLEGLGSKSRIKEVASHYNIGNDLFKLFRMWKFYLLFCAGAFRARYLNLWQFVFSNNGIPEGFQ
jgi:cyclopropane fatty-acyl-phospholipid synthase-like methyltransferase